MLEIKGLRTEFIRWLEENHPEDQRPAVTAKNALFAYYHDVGTPFEAILRDEASMLAAEPLLAEHLRKTGRKNPEEEAAAYRVCWEKFRAFLEATDRLALLETTEDTRTEEQKEE